MEMIFFLVFIVLLSIPFLVLYYNKVVVPRNKRKAEMKKFRETEWTIKVEPASALPTPTKASVKKKVEDLRGNYLVAHELEKLERKIQQARSLSEKATLALAKKAIEQALKK
jgi:hypothetical protein